MLFSLCSCGAEETEEKITYASASPNGKIEIVNRFNEVMATAKASPAAVSYSLNQGAGGCECDNKYIKAAFKTVAGKITDENFSMSTEYGQPNTDSFPLMGSDAPSKLELTDVRSAVSVDNKSDKTYTLLIKINPETNPEQGNSVYGKIFKIEKDADILKNFDVVSEFLTADSYNAEYGVGTIRAEIDKATDHLIKLELHRDVAVTTQVTGHGTLSSVGTVPMSFNYNSTAKYALDWDNPATEDVFES